ncbi:MAG TPA: pseudouridine-5'-phosphate glycosidase [Chloroflexota bacterium]|nr:pseudouridine-5'-phosphate glycosidase [Chloroflexota bacterium]
MEFVVAREVAEALGKGAPVVALETSIVGQGLPYPHNLRAALGCEKAIREVGVVPATVAVLKGVPRVGLTAEEIEALARGREAAKVSARDLGWAIATGQTGATTVAGTIRLAALAGIRFMATGGIGGVHRGQPEDVSADLFELTRSAVAVFCAGPKMILDIPLTVERLESLSVPIFGYRTDQLPGFYVRTTGCRVDARLDTPTAVATAVQASWETGSVGIVVGVPPAADLPGAEAAVARAVASLGAIHGKDVTPFLLDKVAEATAGASLDFNVDLVIHNARVAAECAAAWARA